MKSLHQQCKQQRRLLLFPPSAVKQLFLLSLLSLLYRVVVAVAAVAVAVAVVAVAVAAVAVAVASCSSSSSSSV